MKIGVIMFCTDTSIDIVSLAKHAEALGFESLFVPEHPVIPTNRVTPFAAGGPLPEHYKRTVDPFVGLAAAAGATTRIRLGTGICLVPEHEPVSTAKQIATLDRVSGGRFEFGVGAGWLKEEGDVFKVDWARRWGQTRDYVKAMQVLWTQDEAEYQGTHVSFPKVWSWPKPLQKPYPPVLIAGESDRAAQRIAQFGDGWIPRARDMKPEKLAAGRKQAEAALKAAGRDPQRLTVSLFGAPPDAALNKQWAAAGADRVLHMLPSDDEPKTLERLKQMKKDLL